MRTINAYILGQLKTPVAGAVIAMTSIALLSQSLTQFDAVIGHGQNAFMLFKITFLSLPQLLSLMTPLGLLVGTLVGLNRLHTEQEFVACFASGMSLRDVLRPILRLACVVALLSLFLNLFIEPAGSRLMREALFKIKTDVLSALVREGEFSTTQSGLTIYVQKIEQNGELRGVFIRMPSDNPASTAYRPGFDRTYSAREGRIVNRNGRSFLFLRQGSTEQITDKNILNSTTFKDTSFDITDYFVSDDFLHYKESDRFLHELFYPNKNLDWERGNWQKLAAEGHIRLSSPLYNIAFVLLAFIGVLGGHYSRQGYSNRIAAVVGIAAVIRILGIGLEALCANSIGFSILLYLVPLAVIAFCYRQIVKHDKISANNAYEPFNFVTQPP